MIRLERGRVLEVRERPGRFDLVVECDGRRAQAIAYAALTPSPQIGDIVICNTTAVELGLGTGGVHLVVAIEGREGAVDGAGRGMKARYLPLQVAVAPVEEQAVLTDLDLGGIPVVVAPLHSLIAPAALAIRTIQPETRVVYVMTDEAALPIAFSDLVAELLERSVLAATVTTGQAFGGTIEAVTTHSGLLAARNVAQADVVLVAMGPGNLGTGSRFGFASLGCVAALAAAHALGGDPALVPRISLADPRERHRGLSHHTRTIVELDPRQTRIPLPIAHRDRLEPELAGLAAEPIWIDTSPVESVLHEHRELLRSMGRGFQDDPAFFLAGAAAGIDALG